MNIMKWALAIMNKDTLAIWVSVLTLWLIAVALGVACALLGKFVATIISVL